MGVEQFGAAWCELVDELDWALLGRMYCEGDGSGFFDEALVSQVLDTGLELVDGLASGLPRGGTGRSIYLGAATAELPLVCAEALVLGRETRWLNLPGPELDELRRALGAVGAKLGLKLPQPEASSLATVEDGSCDHLWMASVLTDPDAFPALHDKLYERAGTELATGRGDEAVELARAKDLSRQLLAKAASSAVLSSTDEEFAILVPEARLLGLEIAVPGSGRLTAIVGDTLRFARLRRGAAAVQRPQSRR